MQEIVIEIFTITQHKVNNSKLEIINVTLNTSTWNIHGLNVLIQKATMVKVQLVLESINKKNYFNFLTIYKSKFYSLRVNGGYNITISECQFIDNITLESTMIKVYNSVLNIMNSTFRNIGKSNSGSAIIDASNSLVLIRSVNVCDNYASNGLIEILNGSQLQIERSIFKRNGHYIFSSSIIFIKRNCTVTIYLCEFGDNAALYGACFTIASNSSLRLGNSTFFNNSALRGGVIFHQEIKYTKSDQHDIEGESGTWMSIAEIQGSLKHSPNNSLAVRCEIIGCSFDNQAWEGGDIYIKGIYFQVKLMESHFSSAAYVLGGSMLISGTDVIMTDVLISQCVFENGAVAEGGSIYMERAHINIIDSYFRFGASYVGQFILATNCSVVNIANTTFRRYFLSVGAISIRDGVQLYVTHSKFKNFKNHPMALAFVAATGNCSALVTSSYFVNKEFFGLVVAFDIGMFTNLIVFDSIFKCKYGLNFYIVNGYNNATIHFANCKFHKVSGFRASNETSIFIQDSTIAYCINTLQGGFIQISGKGILNISNTTITGNSIVESSSIILVQSQSSLIVFDSFYSNNVIASHIVVEDDSDITVKGSDFFNNTIIDTYYSKLKGIIITVKYNNAYRNYTETFGSNVLVQETVFRRNGISEEEFFESENSLFSLQSSKEIILLKNIFINNNHINIVTMTGMEQSNLKVIGCTFMDNSEDSINTYSVMDVIIAISYFERKNSWDNHGIDIKYALTVRLFNSIFNSTHSETQIGFPLTLQIETLALYSMNSTFFGKHRQLRTNAKNFLKEAESAGFIYLDLLPKINHAETPYASGNTSISMYKYAAVLHSTL